MGTRCQNEPEVHEILQALRAASRIVAPALIHKEEAIVAPKDLIPYLGTGKHAGRTMVYRLLGDMQLSGEVSVALTSASFGESNVTVCQCVKGPPPGIRLPSASTPTALNFQTAPMRFRWPTRPAPTCLTA